MDLESESDPECILLLLTHTEQLLLVTFCDTTAENGAIFRIHRRTDGGRTDKRGSRNSYLDHAKWCALVIGKLFLVTFCDTTAEN